MIMFANISNQGHFPSCLEGESPLGTPAKNGNLPMNIFESVKDTPTSGHDLFCIMFTTLHYVRKPSSLFS